MTQNNESFNLLMHLRLLGERGLQGAAIALVFVLNFIGMIAGNEAGYGDWVFLPIATVTAGGALGGMFYYLLQNRFPGGGWKKLLVVIASVLVYLATLWLSLVAALSVTGHWN